MTLQSELAALKAEKDKLAMLVNQYASHVLELERRVLLFQQGRTKPTVCDKLINYMMVGCNYRVQDLADSLSIPYNTVHVTLRRNPKEFHRVGWGLYAR